MLDFLDRLRQKPLYVRRNIAIGTTLFLSFIIMSVWLHSWGVSEETSLTPPKGKSPLAVLIKNVGEVKNSASAVLSSSKERIGEMTNTVTRGVLPEESMYVAESPSEISSATLESGYSSTSPVN